MVHNNTDVTVDKMNPQREDVSHEARYNLVISGGVKRDIT